MSKQQHILKLYAVLQNGVKAKTHQANQVHHFIADNGIKVFKQNDNHVLIISSGRYRVPFDETLSIYKGSVGNNIKVHISLKKLVGKLIYWA